MSAETTRNKRTPKKNKNTNLLGDVNGDNVVDAKDGWTRDEIEYVIKNDIGLEGNTEDLAKILPDGYKDEDFIPQPEEDDESSETYDSWDLKVPPTPAIPGGPHPMEGAEPVFAGHDDRMDDDMGPTPSPYNGRRYADRDGLVYPPGSPENPSPVPTVHGSSEPVVYKPKGWIDRPGFINRVHSNWTPPRHRDMVANKKKTPPFTNGESTHSQALTVKIVCDSADEVKKYGAIIEKKFGLPTTLSTSLGGDGATSYLNINYPFIPNEINKLQKLLNGTGIRKFSQIIKEPYHSDHL